MEKYDVTIIGAGLAGLVLAKSLAAEGASIALVDRKQNLSKGVHTTGIFVRKTFVDFDFPQATLGRPISDVTLYSPSLKELKMKSPDPEFRVGKMALLYKTLLEECIELGVIFLPGTRYIGAVANKKAGGLLSSWSPTHGDSSIVSLEKNGKRTHVLTKVLVGADGACSKVAKDLAFDENKEWIVGYEEVLKGVPLEDVPRLYCFLDAKVSPGYLAWISNDGEETHIGVGGYPSRFDPRTALNVFKQEIASKIVELENSETIETRGGRIPVGGVLKRIASRRGLLIGDAAGAVSPLTAGGLDPCLRLSRFASEIILRRLATNDAEELLRYSGAMFRKKFATRLLMRSLLKANRSQAGLNLGFSFLSSTLGRKIAEKIFFRRASFPDPESVGNKKMSPTT
jgi:flavin-dependent dehydrogenase